MLESADGAVMFYRTFQSSILVHEPAATQMERTVIVSEELIVAVVYGVRLNSKRAARLLEESGNKHFWWDGYLRGEAFQQHRAGDGEVVVGAVIELWGPEMYGSDPPSRDRPKRCTLTAIHTRRAERALKRLGIKTKPQLWLVPATSD